MRDWLRKWLGIEADRQSVSDFADHVGGLERRILELEAETARLRVAQYVPPQTPEPPKPKVRQARTFKEFTDMINAEQEQQETNAVR